MAWTIASIPFWLIGVLLVYAGIASGMGVQRARHETDRDLARQFFVTTLAGGVFLVLAAKMVS